MLSLLFVSLLAFSPDTARAAAATEFRIPASALDEEFRLRQLTGSAPTAGYLIRSASYPGGPAAGWAAHAVLHPILPRLESAWNSAIPAPFNDGGMWAGRGANVRLVGGAAVRYGPVTAVLAPELTRSANRDFEFVQSRMPTRSPMLPPWRDGATSADLPIRFGTKAFTTVRPGESSLTVATGSAALGIATETQWWGPGVRNALLMSSNAPGIPHGFLRTARPLRTRLGDVEARLITGVLTESLFFDNDPDNDYRYLSAAAVTLRPAWEPQLTIGIARAVYGPVDRPLGAPRHGLAALTRWNQHRPREAAAGDAPSEQLVSLFWRWVMPAEQLEVYGEWARTELPINLRDLLLAPHHSQGYTFGLAWLGDLGRVGGLRVQAEMTNLENTGKIGGRPTRGLYTSLDVPQGYTHRGQVIGAAIGPGSSSQWLGVDLVRPSTRIGGYIGRVRWDDDAFYTRPVRDRHVAHDVSFILGVRGAFELAGAHVTTDLARDHRLNYLFQNDAYWFDQEQGIDVVNLSLRFSVAPLGRNR